MEASPAAIDDLEPSIFAKVPAFAAAGSGGSSVAIPADAAGHLHANELKELLMARI